MGWRKKGKVKRKTNIGLSKILYGEDLERFRDFITSTNSNLLHSKRRKMICDLLINSGLRESELCDLRIQDTPFVLQRSVISVYLGKNQKDRDIAISDRLAKALVEYIRSIRPKTLPRHILRSDITRPVFYSQRRRPYTPAGIYYLIKTAGEKAGIIKRIKPHMLRHTYATNALSMGMNIRDLQKQLGHSDIRITEMYSHVISSRLLKLANQVDQDFSTAMKLF